MMRRAFYAWMTLAAVCLGGMSGSTALAADPVPAAKPAAFRDARPAPEAIPQRLRKAPYRGKVQVKMMVIHATNSSTGFDPAIKNLQSQLGFLNYKGFRLLFKNEMSLETESTRSLGLFDGKVIEVTLNSATQEKVEMRVRMYNPASPGAVSLNTTVSVSRRGTFFIGGPKYQDGVLLLPITAWY